MKRMNEGHYLNSTSKVFTYVSNEVYAALERLSRAILLMTQIDVGRRVMEAVQAEFPVKRGPGRPPKADLVDSLFTGWKAVKDIRPPRKARVKVYCPVPGCKGLAAPYYGMVCSAHKDVPKSKIAKYRAQKKLVKLGIVLVKSRKVIKKTVLRKKTAKKSDKR
jgi:hypothetical protein